MTRHLAIGDIHGCYTALLTLIPFVEVTGDDTVVMLGDYVNRGPDTRQVIDWLIRFDRTQTLIPLCGNHEVMMLRARQDPSERQRWLSVGGDATLRSYARPEFTDGNGEEPASIADIPDTHWNFLTKRLLPYYECDTHIFVHAGVDPELQLDDQPDSMLFWQRYSDPPRHQSGKVLVCGHTSQKSGLPLSNGNAVCIDTWAFGEGWLSCLDVASGRIWQANQQGKTRSFDLQSGV